MNSSYDIYEGLKLSKKRKKIIDLMISGKRKEEIAIKLGISIKQLEEELNSIRKLVAKAKDKS